MCNNFYLNKSSQSLAIVYVLFSNSKPFQLPSLISYAVFDSMCKKISSFWYANDADSVHAQ
mgnify:CR=1 FL=1